MERAAVPGPCQSSQRHAPLAPGSTLTARGSARASRGAPGRRGATQNGHPDTQPAPGGHVGPPDGNAQCHPLGFSRPGSKARGTWRQEGPPRTSDPLTLQRAPPSTPPRWGLGTPKPQVGARECLSQPSPDRPEQRPPSAGSDGETWGARVQDSPPQARGSGAWLVPRSSRIFTRVLLPMGLDLNSHACGLQVT